MNNGEIEKLRHEYEVSLAVLRGAMKEVTQSSLEVRSALEKASLIIEDITNEFKSITNRRDSRKATK